MNLEEALAQARRDVAASPEAWEPRARLGALLVALSDFEEGAAELRRALKGQPHAAAVHNNLGAALLALGRHKEARASFERALEIDPSYHDATTNLARSIVAAGEQQYERGDALAAAQSYRSALALDENLPRAWEGMSIAFDELGALPEAIDAMKRAISLSPDTPFYYRQLGHLDSREITAAMVTRLEQIAARPQRIEDAIEAELALFHAYKSNDPGRAFDHLLRSGALRRKTERYDEAATLAAFDNIAATFTKDQIARFAWHGLSSEIPIFIIGMPRSGTTLVEQILASHPDVYGAGELPTFEEGVEGIGFTTGQQIHALGQRYVAIVQDKAPLAKRITDKMPFNFLYAGVIAMALPRAHIIHVRRDPLDTAFSCFEQSFVKDAVTWSYDLGEIGRYMRGYLRLMEHWRTALPEGLMLEVRYEDVVADLEGQARRIVAFCGLEWDERCLDFHKTGRPVRTSSSAQVRKPLYASSVGRAKPYRAFMQPFLDALNG